MLHKTSGVILQFPLVRLLAYSMCCLGGQIAETSGFCVVTFEKLVFGPLAPWLTPRRPRMIRRGSTMFPSTMQSLKNNSVHALVQRNVRARMARPLWCQPHATVLQTVIRPPGLLVSPSQRDHSSSVVWLKGADPQNRPEQVSGESCRRVCEGGALSLFEIRRRSPIQSQLV